MVISAWFSSKVKSPVVGHAGFNEGAFHYSISIPQYPRHKNALCSCIIRVGIGMEIAQLLIPIKYTEPSERLNFVIKRY